MGRVGDRERIPMGPGLAAIGVGGAGVVGILFALMTNLISAAL
ncbi:MULTISPECIES: hypothetical protein [unclassified Microbacterium]